MPSHLMITLTLVVTLLAGQVCPPPPRAQTVRVDGDSRMQGGLCSSTSPSSPPAYVDANLPGGADSGWLFKNAGVTGTTPAQQLTAYQHATTGAAKSCNGERCAHQVVGGAANCLRVSALTPEAAAACLAPHTTLVDDALSHGVAVVWFNETDYTGWSMAAGTATQVPVYNGLWEDACNAQTCEGEDCIPRGQNPLLVCLDIYTISGVPKTNSCDFIHDNQTGTNALGAWILEALLSIP